MHFHGVPQHDGSNDDIDDVDLDVGDDANRMSPFKSVTLPKTHVVQNWRSQCSVSEHVEPARSTNVGNTVVHARNVFEEPHLDRVRCCALGVGSDAHLHIPVLMDVVIYVHVPTDDVAGGQYLLIQVMAF
jgi:hypothetical protein